MTHFSKRSMATLCVFIVVNLFAVLFILRARARHVLPQASANASGRLSGERRPGDAAWIIESNRERQQEIIGRIAKESLEELIDKLVDDEHVYYPMVDSHEGNPRIAWPLCLSNRRVWRIISELERLGPEQRQAKLDRAFDHAFSVHRAAYERSYNWYRDPTNPQNTQSMLATQCGLCGALFLSAQFEKPQRLFERIERLRRFARETLERFGADDYEIRVKFPGLDKPTLVDLMARDIEPDDPFYMNLVLNVCPKGSRERLLADSGLGPLVRCGAVDITRWDAEPGAFDWVHRHCGVPISRDDVTESIPTCVFTGHSLPGTGVQEGAVAKLLELAPKACAEKAKD